MQLSYKFISTLSGKSVVLMAGGSRYAFGMFDGFQRYCIESQLSMCSLDAVFLPDRWAVPALIGAYFSLGETKRELAVVAEHPVDMDSVHEFGQVQDTRLVFLREYRDEFLGVTSVAAGGRANYLVRFARIDGEFHVEKIAGSGIPARLYGELARGNKVTYGGVEYDGADYTGDPIDLGCTLVIFSDDGLEGLQEHFGDVRTFVCMNAAAARYVAGVAGDRVVYYVEDMGAVEYPSLYEIQREMNEADSNYLVPYYRPDDADQHTETGVVRVRNGDSLEFNRRRGFTLTRHENVEYAGSANRPVYPSAIFLGTGCSIPSKYRNVSSVLYENGESSILIDCGEDTLSQIQRVYGSLDTLKRLKAIYLSHSHADHILGIAGVLGRLTHSVAIVAPRRCRRFIDGYLADAPVPHRYIETDAVKRLERSFYEQNGGFEGRGWLEREPTEEFIRGIDLGMFTMELEIDEFRVRICGCAHSADSTSVAITDRAAGKKLSYSGDTAPSVLFSALAMDSDLLIHEATFNDEQMCYAERRSHATEGEALAVYRHSRARNLLLTHFTTRNRIRAEKCFAADFYRFVFE